MAEFDAKKESGDWVAKWIDGPDLDPEDVVEVFESLTALLHHCQDATREEVEGECVPQCTANRNHLRRKREEEG